VRIIQTADLSPVGHDKVSYGGEILSPLEQHCVYCGLDSCVTLEIQEEISPLLDPETQLIYNFERALQAPVLEMTLRGILCDTGEVMRLREIYEKRRKRIYYIIQQYAMVVWGQPLNPASYKQLKDFFYDTMSIPTQYIWEKGVKKVSCNRESLEKVQQYRYARPIVTAILAHRDVAGKIKVLKSGIDQDRRMRFSYNIGGTNTGRFSCNKNVFGGGTNGNNITDELRRIFVADEGKKFAYLDLEQAESRVTAYVSGDEAYIEACESDDLHTTVAQLIWPDLEWSPNNDPEVNKKVAKQLYYRHWSYRDMSKRGGHLTNYLGQARSNAKKLKVSFEVMKQFQSTYLVKAFSGVRRWHGDVARILNTEATLTTPLGRRRLFFGRNYADDVLRKAVAYTPQSTIGDLLNIGMWRVWRFIPEVQLLTQLYDAILIQYDEELEEEVIKKAMELMTIPVEVEDLRYRDARVRTMIVPVEASVGWNWAKIGDNNPDGLATFHGRDARTRQNELVTDLLKIRM